MTTSVDTVAVEGDRSDKDLIVYALSTCAFCRKAMDFLSEHGFGYSYVYLDELELETKRSLKADLKARFKKLPVFPILVIDDDEALSGFVEARWKEALGIED
ncbi:glutaredoxin family protein [Spirochaeta africana]|uniref:Glutaredoxin-like protein n=1 Tax=Spirochaeta africana (strain ATCC 700263 / DSM 8902 / Z-7692) TaxID=889378 RepID=H9UG26_SPIAZ|nr:glutaredoxin family protein [Spirochaeta africana]AFG36469.1 glutaredoxin-like protein [Spirochaeta africana DSM 8902]